MKRILVAAIAGAALFPAYAFASVALTETGQASGNVSAPYVYPNVTYVNAAAVSNVPANCTVSVDGGALVAAAGQGTTTNYITFGTGSSPLAAGDYTANFQCTATGADNGSGTATASVSFTVAPPTVALMVSGQASGNVSPPYLYPNVTYVNAAAVSNVPANCTVSIDGGALVAAAGQGTTTNYITFGTGSSPLAAGDYTANFQCTATGADNGSGTATASVSFTVAPPTVALMVSGQASGNVSPPYLYPNVTYVNVAAVANVPANCTVSIDGGAPVAASGQGTTTNYSTFGTASSPLAAGTYTADFQCTATGANNGSGTGSTTVSFTIAAPTPPTLTFSASPSGSYAYNENVTLTAALSNPPDTFDHLEISFTYIGIDGQPHTLGNPVSCAALSCQESIVLNQGMTLTFTATAFDKNGAIIAQSQPLTIAEPAPPPLVIEGIGIAVNGQAATSPLPAGTPFATLLVTTNDAASCTVDGAIMAPHGGVSGYLESYDVSGLTNGFSHTYAIVCQTIALNGSTASTTLPLAVASAVGVPLTLSGQTSANVSAPYVYPNVTFVNAAAVSNVPANCTVSIDGGAPIAASGQGTTTNYSTFGTPSAPLAAGTYTAAFACTATGDNNGSGTASTTVTFTVAPPGIALTVSGQTSGNVSPPYIYPNVTYVNAAAVTNVPANCTVSVDGGSAVNAAGQGTTTNYITFGTGSSSLAAGDYTANFQCTATGADNGTGTATASVAFTVHPAATTALTLSGQTVGNVDAPYVYPNVTFVNALVIGNVPANCTVSVNGGAPQNASGQGSTANYYMFGTLTSPLAAGSYDAYFNCTATGAVNGSGTASLDVPFTVQASTSSCTANAQCAAGFYCGQTAQCLAQPTSIVFTQPANGSSFTILQSFLVTAEADGGAGTIGLHIDTAEGQSICAAPTPSCRGVYDPISTGPETLIVTAYAMDVNNTWLPVGTPQTIVVNRLPFNVAAINIQPNPAEIWIHGHAVFAAGASDSHGTFLPVTAPLSWSFVETGACGTITPTGVFHPTALSSTCSVSATLTGPGGTFTGVTSSTASVRVFDDPAWTFYAALSTSPTTHVTQAREDLNVTFVAQMTNFPQSAAMDTVTFDDGKGDAFTGFPGNGCPTNAYCAPVSNLVPGTYSFKATPIRQNSPLTVVTNAISLAVTPKPSVTLSLAPVVSNNHYLVGSTVTITALPLNFAQGTIQSVKFYSTQATLGTVFKPPYVATYSPSGPAGGWTDDLGVDVTDVNGLVTHSSPALITIDAPPTLISTPAEQYGVMGSSVVFSAFFLGNTPMTYQWQKAARGSLVFADLGASTTGQFVPEYATPSLTLADDGTVFRVKANNGIGSTVISGTAAVHVSASAVSLVSLSTASVTAGQSATLSMNYQAGVFPAAGIAAEIDLPPDVTFTSVTLNGLVAPSGTRVSSATVSGGLILHLGASTAFSTGTVLRISLQVSSTAASGTYPVAMSSATLTLSSQFGGLLPSGVANGALVITALPPVTPVVTISAPSAKATVDGTVLVAGTVTAAPGVSLSDIVFGVDGSSIADNAAPAFSFTWNTRGVSNGTHTLTVQATDFDNHVGSSTVTVTVANAVLTPPATAEIDLLLVTSTGAPVAGASVSVSTDAAFAFILPAATDAFGALRISFTLANSTTPISPQLTVTDVPRAIVVSTTVFTLRANDVRALSLIEPVASSSSTTPTPPAAPIVFVTQPASSAVLQGQVDILGTVTVDTRTTLATVTFAVDGSSVAVGTAAAFQFPWDTTQVSNGPHTLTVMALDALSQSGSRTVSVQVANTIVSTGPVSCQDTTACGARSYCDLSGTCAAIPAATVVLSAPGAGAVFDVGDTTNFAAAVQGASTTTLAQLTLTIQMDGTLVCGGQNVDCDTSRAGSNPGPHVFTSAETGVRTVLATATLPDIKGMPITVAQSTALTLTVQASVAPAVLKLNVPALTAGDADTVITVQGQGFKSGVTLAADGQPQLTTLDSPGQLTVTLSSALFANPGVIELTVSGSAPFGLQVVTAPHIPQLGGLPATEPLDATLDLPTETYPTVFTWSFIPRTAVSAQAIAAALPDGSHTLATPTPSLSLGQLHLDPGAYQLEVTETNLAGRASPPGTAVITLVSTELGGVVVYPNPWRADQHSSKPLTFGGMPAGGTVKIFSVSGHWIATVHESGGQAQWNLLNDSGDKVQSGLYLYLITDSQNQKTHGKFAIIR